MVAEPRQQQSSQMRGIVARSGVPSHPIKWHANNSPENLMSCYDNLAYLVKIYYMSRGRMGSVKTISLSDGWENIARVLDVFLLCSECRFPEYHFSDGQFYQ